MVELRIDTTIEDAAVLKLLRQIDTRLADATPAFRTIGEIVESSIQKTFRLGGRPVKWPRSKRVKDAGGQTLVDTAVLKNSFTVHPQPDRVSVGTADKRAAVHHFGAEKGSFGTVSARVGEHLRTLATGKRVKVSAHTRKMALPWGDIPARKILQVHDEDWAEITAALGDYLVK